MKKFSLWLLVSLISFGAAATDLHVFIDTGTSMYKGDGGQLKNLYKTAGVAVGDFFTRRNIYESKRSTLLTVSGVFKLKKEDKLQIFDYLQHRFNGGKPDISNLGASMREIPGDWFTNFDKADEATKLSLFDTQIFNNAENTIFVVITNSGNKREAFFGSYKGLPLFKDTEGVYFARHAGKGIKVFIVDLPDRRRINNDNIYKEKCCDRIEKALEAAWNATIYAAPEVKLSLEIEGSPSGNRTVAVGEKPLKELAFYGPLTVFLNAEKLDNVREIIVNGRALPAVKGRRKLFEQTAPERYKLNIAVVGLNGDRVEYPAIGIKLLDKLVFDARANGISGSSDPKAPGTVAGKSPFAVTFSTTSSNADGAAQWFAGDREFAGGRRVFTAGKAAEPVRCRIKGYDGRYYTKYFRIVAVPPEPKLPAVTKFAWSVKLNETELVGRSDVPVLKGQEKLSVTFRAAAAGNRPLKWFRNNVPFTPRKTEIFTADTVLRCEAVDGNGQTHSCSARIEVTPFAWSVKLAGKELADESVELRGRDKLTLNIPAAANGKPLRWFINGKPWAPRPAETFTENTVLRCEIVDRNGTTHVGTARIRIDKTPQPERQLLTVKIGGEERRKENGVITVPGSMRSEEPVTFSLPTVVQKNELEKYTISYGEKGEKGEPVRAAVDKYEWEKALPSGKVHQVVWYYNGQEVERFTIDIRRGRYLVIQDRLKRKPEKLEGEELPKFEFGENEGNPVSFALCGVPDDTDLGKYFLVVMPAEGEPKRIALSEFAKAYKEGFGTEEKSEENAGGSDGQKPEPKRCGVSRGEFLWEYRFDANTDNKVQIVYAAAPGQPDEKLEEFRVVVNESAASDDDSDGLGTVVGIIVLILLGGAVFWWYMKSTLRVTLARQNQEKSRRLFSGRHELDKSFDDGPDLDLSIEKGAAVSFVVPSGSKVRITEIVGKKTEAVEARKSLEIKRGEGRVFKLSDGTREWTLSVRK